MRRLGHPSPGCCRRLPWADAASGAAGLAVPSHTSWLARLPLPVSRFYAAQGMNPLLPWLSNLNSILLPTLNNHTCSAAYVPVPVAYQIGNSFTMLFQPILVSLINHVTQFDHAWKFPSKIWFLMKFQYRRAICLVSSSHRSDLLFSLVHPSPMKSDHEVDIYIRFSCNLCLW